MIVQFGFTTSDWFVSRIIRWATRAKVSHAFVILRGTDLGDMVLEAGWDGWRLRPLVTWLTGSTRIVALLEAPADRAAAVAAAAQGATKDVGEPYDYGGLLGMACVAFGRWLGKKRRNPFRSSTSMFCSDAVVAEILQPAGWPGADKLDPQSVSPEDLLEFLDATGARQVAA